MRRRMFAWLGFFLTSSAVASAQDIVPPPGFSPAPGGTAAPPAARIVGDPENLPPAGDFDDPYGRRSQLSYDPTTPYSPYSPSPPVPAYFGADTWLAPRVWVRAEFLYWWTKASPVPAPLVTLGDPGDSIPGAIGQPGTSVLLGNQDIDIRGRPGGRFTLGIALDPERTWGLEGSYLFLANTSVTHGVFSDGSSGSPALFVPFFNPNLPGEDSTLLADPGAFAGSARLTIQSFFQGAEANLLYNVQNANGLRFDLLGGFRYLNLQESLLFTTDSPSVPPNAPDTFHTFDQFDATNNFYGGQLGARAAFDNGRLYVNATGKVALGATVETVGIHGGTLTNALSSSGTLVAYPGAYFSQPTNIGTQSRSQFAVVPEVDLNFGVRVSPWASFIVGYSFLYVSSVARPGDQLDRVINPTQAPAITGIAPGSLVGMARPMQVMRDTDFWVQGLNFGLELRY